MCISGETTRSLARHQPMADCLQHGMNSVPDFHLLLLYSCGNATKAKIKNTYPFPYIGSTMHNQLDDGNGWVSDNDGGRKTNPLDSGAWHYRVYAAGGSNMQNATWNKYVVVTTHYDHLLLLVGWSEDC